jgi:hypothetical protein
MDLLKAVPDIVDEMDHIQNLSMATIKVSPALTDNIRLVALLNALALCILITVFYEYGLADDNDGGVTVKPTVDPIIKIVMLVLGVFQIILAVTLIIGELINRGNLIIKSRWREFVDEQKA